MTATEHGREPVGDLLHVLMHDQEIARLSSTSKGRLELRYLPGAPSVTRGLSAVLPVVAGRPSSDQVRDWIAGLLPDRDEVLRRWRHDFGLKRTDPFALLWHVGEDVAGAARFVRPERLDAQESALDPMTDADIADRIRQVSTDAASWGASDGTGQFSLAGAQAKFALAQTPDGWARPSGRSATTHIFKPAIPRMVDQDLNEHLTMRLASALGLPVAPTEVQRFEDVRALVVTRFDRYQGTDGSWHRVHQEDAVQALGMSPTLKYEQHGGPGVREVARLLRMQITGGHGPADLDTFVDAVAFNWFVAGTDAHARNYALLHHGAQTRLAPLYDLNSFLPYADGRPMTLAMKLGFTERRPDRITERDIDELARDCGLSPQRTLTRFRDLGEGLLSVSEGVLTTPDVTAWNSTLPDTLSTELSTHTRSCLRRLGPTQL